MFWVVFCFGKFMGTWLWSPLNSQKRIDRILTSWGWVILNFVIVKIVNIETYIKTFLQVKLCSAINHHRMLLLGQERFHLKDMLAYILKSPKPLFRIAKVLQKVNFIILLLGKWINTPEYLDGILLKWLYLVIKWIIYSDNQSPRFKMRPQ